MCGGGSIGFQITEGWAGAHVWSGDVEPKELRRYAANVERMLSAPSSPASWRSEARRMAGCCWDARRLPIRAGVVDSVVRDWRHPTAPHRSLGKLVAEAWAHTLASSRSLSPLLADSMWAVARSQIYPGMWAATASCWAASQQLWLGSACVTGSPACSGWLRRRS